MLYVFDMLLVFELSQITNKYLEKDLILGKDSIKPYGTYTTFVCNLKKNNAATI